MKYNNINHNNCGRNKNIKKLKIKKKENKRNGDFIKMANVFFIGGTARAIAKIHSAYFNNLAAQVHGYAMKTEDIFALADYFFTNEIKRGIYEKQ